MRSETENWGVGTGWAIQKGTSGSSPQFKLEVEFHWFGCIFLVSCQIGLRVETDILGWPL